MNQEFLDWYNSQYEVFDFEDQLQFMEHRKTAYGGWVACRTMMNNKLQSLTSELRTPVQQYDKSNETFDTEISAKENVADAID